MSNLVKIIVGNEEIEINEYTEQRYGELISRVIENSLAILKNHDEHASFVDEMNMLRSGENSMIDDAEAAHKKIETHVLELAKMLAEMDGTMAVLEKTLTKVSNRDINDMNLYKEVQGDIKKIKAKFQKFITIMGEDLERANDWKKLLESTFNLR